MAKEYFLRFGAPKDPRTYTGLSPTLVTFSSFSGVALTAPGITEIIPSSGAYKFEYTPSFSIYFLADGGATLTASERYLVGVLDPIDTVNETVGSVADSFGSTSVDPSTVFGYMKRALEFNEGNAIYLKSSAQWQIFSRGSSTLLAVKGLSSTATQTTKS